MLSLFNRRRHTTRRKSSRRDTRRRMFMEQLQSREMMAADVVVNWNDGVVTVDGTNERDVIVINRVNINGEDRIAFDGASFTMPDGHTSLPAGYVDNAGWFQSFTIHGHAGDDLIVNNTNIPMTIHGGDGNDFIVGGDANDEINGSAGNDFIEGGAGNDRIWGSEGEDSLHGGRGTDYLVGGNDGAQDVLRGNGSDQLVNPHGEEAISDGAARDYNGGYTGDQFGFNLNWNNGVVWVEGTGNHDTIVIAQSEGQIFIPGWGQQGYQVADVRYVDIDAFGGNDTVVNTLSVDSFQKGGAGNDTLRGGRGADVLWGNADEDYLVGGWGSDSTIQDDIVSINIGDRELHVAGGDGDDRLIVRQAGNSLQVLQGTVSDGAPGDREVASIALDHLGIQLVQINGGKGHDYIRNDTPIPSTMFGGDGNDTIYGGSARDRIEGDNDNDTIDGNGGDDLLFGGRHDDRIVGGTGNDILWGNDGNDTLEAGSGLDSTIQDDNVIYDLGSRRLTVNGTDGVDKLIVEQDEADGRVHVKIGGAGDVTEVATFETAFAEIDRIYIFGFAGDDTIKMSGVNIAGEIQGGADNDTIYGGNAGDQLFGGIGNDTIDGNGGNDEIEGGVGNDTLNGGSDNDQVFGGAGDDTIDGGGGDEDLLFGQEGDDAIIGWRRSIDGPTVIIDFNDPTQVATRDILQNIVNTFNVGAFGFTLPNSFNRVANAVLDEVREHFLASSLGRPLNIDFQLGDIGQPPQNGSRDHYYIQVGTGGTGALGVAGLNVIRDENGNAERRVGTVIGSVFTNQIQSLGWLTPFNALASGNLVFTTHAIADVVSHEIGHALSLEHVVATAVTPTGLPPIMGTGATGFGLPNQAHLQMSEFTSEELTQLEEALQPREYRGSFSAGDFRLSVQSSILHTSHHEYITVTEIVGTDSSDSITLTESDGQIHIAETGQSFDLDALGAVTIYGLGGDDVISNQTSLPVIVYAGGGNDILHGGSGNDTLYGNAGNDVIYGGGGADVIDGGLGDDELHGDAKDKDPVVKLQEEHGFRMYVDHWHFNSKGLQEKWFVDSRNRWHVLTPDGGLHSYNNGTFTLLAHVAPGIYDNPFLLFNATDDDAADEIHGGEGHDVLFGGADDDTLSGDAGNDIIYGGKGADTLRGGTENDTLNGGYGRDALHGGDGNDTLDGGDHSDRLYGDAGDDTVYGGLGWHGDLIEGGSGNDLLDGGDGNDLLRGDVGHDALHGGRGTDTLFGDDGHDVLVGGEGADKVYGGSDDDLLVGDQIDRTALNAVFAAWVGQREFDFALSIVENDWQADTIADATGTNLTLEDIVQTATVDGTVHLLTGDGTLWKHTLETGWVTLGNDVVKYQLRSSGELWTLHKDNWVRRDGANVWAGSRDFAFRDDGAIYWLSTSGVLLRHTSETGWMTLGSDVSGFEWRDGNLWMLYFDGSSSVSHGA